MRQWRPFRGAWTSSGESLAQLSGFGATTQQQLLRFRGPTGMHACQGKLSENFPA